VGRPSQTSVAPSWDALYELAAPQAGYFSASQAREAGYSLPLLQYYFGRGRLQRVARGIFRLVHFPAGEHEDLVVLWLWSGRVGVFSHETALALHELSDVMPATRHMTVPPSWKRRRVRLPDGIELHFAQVPASQTEWVGAVPVTAPLRLIADCVAAHVSPEWIEQAARQGVERGLFSSAAVKKARGRRAAKVDSS
jgi:predicted transcriptional regulator of viral defense system